MTNTTAAVLRDIYDAWRAQNLEWLASYLPDDFCHVMNIPTAVHPICGESHGKKIVLERWRLIVAQYEFLKLDTSKLMIDNNRAAVEIPFTYRHRQTGALLQTTKANIWVLEEGWPVKLTEYYDVGEIQAFVREIGGKIEL